MLLKVKKTLAGLWSLIVGLKITGHNFCSPQLTVHYPREEVTNLDGFNGHVELVPSPKDPMLPKCIACGACARNCPSQCISLDFEKIEPAAQEGEDSESGGKKKKSQKKVTRFTLDFNYCSLCGLCVRSCPVGSLRFSSDVYLAGFDPQEFRMDLLERMRGQIATQGEKD